MRGYRFAKTFAFVFQPIQFVLRQVRKIFHFVFQKSVENPDGSISRRVEPALAREYFRNLVQNYTDVFRRDRPVLALFESESVFQKMTVRTQKKRLQLRYVSRAFAEKYVVRFFQYEVVVGLFQESVGFLFQHPCKFRHIRRTERAVQPACKQFFRRALATGESFQQQRIFPVIQRVALSFVRCKRYVAPFGVFAGNQRQKRRLSRASVRRGVRQKTIVAAVY